MRDRGLPDVVGEPPVLIGPLRAAWIGLAVLLACAGCQRSDRADDMPSTRRHVLLLTVDTLRPDYLSANGYGLPTSPFLDSLVTRGFAFTRAITPIPRTTQALASLLTGTYPHTTKVRTLVDALAPNLVSLAQLAQKRGYATLAVVSNHILVPERGLGRGFDVYDFGDDARDAAATTAAALRHVREHRPGDAVFMWVHYIDPHVPYYPPPHLANEFDPTYAGRYQLHFGAIKGGVGNQAYPEDLPKAQAVFRNPLSAEVNAHIRKLYAADVRYTDDHIARLVSGLRAQLGDDWLIIFTADHGESLGEQDYYYDHGAYVYNAALRVPLAFVVPQGDPLHGSGVVSDWVSLVDVMPTVVELLGLSLPARLDYGIDGRSLVPYMRGQDLPARALFAESGRAYFPAYVRRRVDFDVAGRFRTVLLGDWKLIGTPGQREGLDFELYNVSDDPYETVDLYTPGHPGAEQLKTLLRQWQRPAEPEARRVNDADRERLRALGYVD